MDDINFEVRRRMILKLEDMAVTLGLLSTTAKEAISKDVGALISQAKYKIQAAVEGIYDD